MNKFIKTTAFALVASLSSIASAENLKLSVAATPVPAAEVLEFMKPALAKKGVDLTVHVFTDYIQPNQQVADGDINMNCFQHVPHLDSFNKRKNTNLVPVGGMYLPPMAAYSKKIKNLSELKDGARVSIPNDTTNSTRALLILQQAGLIKLKDPKNLFSTAKDIAENPKKLRFIELEAAGVPRSLPDVDIAVINTNYALEVGLNPQKDSIILEDSNSPYANVCAAPAEFKDNEALKILMAEWGSEETKKFILDKYKGTVIPRKD